MNIPSLDRIINIALVGHVANGKTTLVNALTGVNTKRSSSEKKSGRTIKLGYANCIIWQCVKCMQIYSSGQTELPECCMQQMEKKAIVSFVDAPGHHSYIHTMVKGATVVDGALLVTDVRKEPMQMQTIEHLAILSILNVKNIIVIQNKADLVSPDRCVEHYDLLKKELCGTSAENSPIIPISAQNNINIDVLRKSLLTMVTGILNSIEKASDSQKTGVFQIIRSFDINKPGDDISNIKGGVLGGTVIGNAQYQIGDKVEIRPGVLQKNNINKTITYIPLQTEIRTIFAESKSCNSTTIGGLYGIGTGLDPTLTIADSLSGSLLGKPGELPPVVYEIEMRITHVNLDSSHKVRVKPGGLYRLIIGNVVVDAESVESKTSKSVIMKLTRPICTIETICLIYNVESSNTRLIAFGSFGINKACLSVIEVEQYNYLELIKDLKIHERAFTKIPVVRMVRENRNVIWTNIDAFAKAIYRTPQEIIKYLAVETLVNISICAGGLRFYKSNLNSAKIESIMKKYIKDFVLCGQCKSLNTSSDVCNECGACVRDLRV